MTKKAKKTKAKKAKANKLSRGPKATLDAAIKKNVSALVEHTEVLNQHSAALATHAHVMLGVSAKQLVYSVLGEPESLPDTTPLSKLGFDTEALAGLAEAIQERGVNVDTGLVQSCKKVFDLVRVVSAAMS